MQSSEQRLRNAGCGVRNSAIPNPQSAVPSRRVRGERGQAVEYAIVFPLQLMMTLAIIQLAQIFVAKQVVEYAAFCGARAKLVNLSDDEARAAAIIPLSSICGSNPALDGAGTPPNPDAAGPHALSLQLPGWGSRTMSSQTYQAILAGIPAGPDGDAQRTQLNLYYNSPHSQYLSGCGTASDPDFTPVNGPQASPALPGIGWAITFNYPLRVPVGNVVAYQIGQVFLGVDSQYLTTVNNQPCIVMTALCVLPSPLTNQ